MSYVTNLALCMHSTASSSSANPSYLSAKPWVGKNGANIIHGSVNLYSSSHSQIKTYEYRIACLATLQWDYMAILLLFFAYQIIQQYKCILYLGVKNFDF